MQYSKALQKINMGLIMLCCMEKGEGGREVLNLPPLFPHLDLPLHVRMCHIVRHNVHGH